MLPELNAVTVVAAVLVCPAVAVELVAAAHQRML